MTGEMPGAETGSGLDKAFPQAIFGSSRIAVIGRGGILPGSLVLRLVSAKDGPDMYGIGIADRAGKIVLDLGPFADEDAVAVWRSISATSGLPLVIAAAGGELHQPYEQIGRLQLGPTRARRRHLAVLSGRRPRFLAKRKTGRLPSRPLVYREREMVSGVEKA